MRSQLIGADLFSTRATYPDRLVSLIVRPIDLDNPASWTIAGPASCTYLESSCIYL